MNVTDRRLLVPVEGPGHSYSVNGRPLVGVTSVIHTVLRAPQLEEWFKRVGTGADAIRDEAAAFGKSIHAGLSAHANGQTLILEMPEAWEATVQAGRDWIDQNVTEILAVEQAIANLAYGYAGKPDLYAMLRGHKRPVLVDYKTTGDVYWSHPWQLAAYRKAQVETTGDPAADRMMLRFCKEEPGKVYKYEFKHHDRDFAAFGYCLGLFNIMKGGIA